uniref:Non-structural maintenance of chromosomes element 4 n=1 Tax=Denticeps clupeoides TaxID=299321 RepID=A0AAY4D887_9TELE
MSESRRRVNRELQADVGDQQNGMAGRSRVERGPEMAEDDDAGAGPSGVREDEDDNPSHRREIRSKYRDLINSVQQNREDMLNPANSKLTDVLEEANKLFVDVSQAREAVLDSQLLVLATDLGKEKANQLQAEGSLFDPAAYAEHLVSFCLHVLYHFFSRLGSFLSEPPQPKQRVERQRKAPSNEANRIMPLQLKKMEESHQEATEKEVERILGYLQGYFEKDPTLPISYYEFVIDATSFSRTVENIFHTSFLIRDGLARIYLNEEKIPCIAPVDGEGDAAMSASRQQCVISISPKSWREIIDAFQITGALIPAQNVLQQETQMEETRLLLSKDV